MLTLTPLSITGALGVVVSTTAACALLGEDPPSQFAPLDQAELTDPFHTTCAHAGLAPTSAALINSAVSNARLVELFGMVLPHGFPTFVFPAAGECQKGASNLSIRA
jgi:hypothetical protein